MTTLHAPPQDLDEAIRWGMRFCIKLPQPWWAQQMLAPFSVCTAEGDHEQGEAGDYLMCSVTGCLSVCSADEFGRRYEWVTKSSMKNTVHDGAEVPTLEQWAKDWCHYQQPEERTL